MTDKDKRGEIVLYQTPDGATSIDVKLEDNTVWLTQAQIAVIMGTRKSAISKHISNIYKSGELCKESTVSKMEIVQTEGKRQVARRLDLYNLDMVLSVGYRVNSINATRFRQWASSVLKEYLIRGYAANDTRLKQLGEAVRILRRTTAQIDADGILSVIEQYTRALDLLDDYDHQRVSKPEGANDTYVLTYEECREVIDSMRFGAESNLFGNEKDDSFRGSIGAVYQTFSGVDLYPSLEEKAANLLYFITKNHSFSDGNKRIAAAVFLHFLMKNGILCRDGQKRIADSTLVAMTIMIAESDPAEKDTITSLVMNFLA